MNTLRILCFLILAACPAAAQPVPKPVAAAGTLTGTTLASNVTASSLTSFGTSPTILTPTVTGTITLAGTASQGAINIGETSSNGDSNITWGNVANGNCIGFRGSSQEFIVSSRSLIAIVSDQAGFGTGFIQFGNNMANGEKIFVSSEGTANATLTGTPSHRLNLNSSYYSGGATNIYSSIRAISDSSGVTSVDIYPVGSNAAGVYNANLFGTGVGGYAYTLANRGLGVYTTGVRVPRTAYTAPTYSFDTSTTTGLGCDTGGNWSLVRSGALNLQSDAGYGMIASTILLNAGISRAATIVAPGTTTAPTINKCAGRINFAASETSKVVTNSFCLASSLITCTIATNDTTAAGVKVVAGAGSFTVYLSTAPTGETAVNFKLENIP